MIEVNNVCIKPKRGLWVINVEGSPEKYATPVGNRDKALFLGRRLAQTWEVFLRIYDITGELVSEEDYRNYYQQNG